MKPFFMQFKQGDRQIAVNMNQVCYMAPSAEQTIMVFNAILQDEPAYILVDETFEAIGKRSDWVQR